MIVIPTGAGQMRSVWLAKWKNLLFANNIGSCQPAVSNTSRKAAQEYSPGREPWVQVGNDSSPEGRKKRSHAHS
jgi:hypothetical protein